MKNELTTEEIALGIHEWCLERVRGTALNRGDARALLAEFYEWLVIDAIRNTDGKQVLLMWDKNGVDGILG